MRHGDGNAKKKNPYPFSKMKDQQQQAMLYRAETAVNSASYSRPKTAKLFAQSGPYSEERI